VIVQNKHKRKCNLQKNLFLFTIAGQLLTNDMVTELEMEEEYCHYVRTALTKGSRNNKIEIHWKA
jgi:hypothetical protein